MSKPDADVIIVGGGIVGICCALSLAERDLSVHLIDRDEPGQSASYGNAGVISPWSIVPQSTPGLWKQVPSMLLKDDGPIAIRPGHFFKFFPWAVQFLRNGTDARVEEISNAMHTLNQSCIELYRKHLTGTGHEALLKDSYYVHAYRIAENARLDAPGYRIRADKGADLERIDATDLRVLEPALSHEFKAAIIIKGQARAMAPGRIGQVLAKKARKNGVTVTRANVSEIRPNQSGRWTISTDGEIYSAPKIVMAAGAWSARLLMPLGVDMPLEAERGYHVQFAEPDIELNHSVMDTDGKVAASSMLDGLRIAGTAEFAGLDAPINEKRVASLVRLAKIMLPELNTEKMQSWAGFRPSFPDSLPVIGEFETLKGLFGAFGHAHYGLMMAPQTGEIIADLISNRLANIDLTAFRSQRFR